MSDAGGPFEWDEENEPVFISDEDFDDQPEAMAIEEFRRMMLHDRIISDFVNEAWEVGGIDTITEVLSHIERKVGWRTEILATSGALDDIMLYEHETFNPLVWDFYTNSDEHEQLIYDVVYESEIAMRKFARRLAGKETTKDRFKEVGRKLAKKLMRFFD
jgi:hypothetical protein